MMDTRKFIVTIALFSGLAAIAVPVQKHNPARPAQHRVPIMPILKHRYEELVHAFKTKNVNEYSAMLAPDFKVTAEKHTMDKKAAVKDFERQCKTVKLITWTHKVTHGAFYNDKKAVLNVTAHFVGILSGNRKFDLNASGVDTWVKTPKGWLWQSEVVSSMKPIVKGSNTKSR